MQIQGKCLPGSAECRQGITAVRFLRTGTVAETLPDELVETEDGYVTPRAVDDDRTIARMAAARVSAQIDRMTRARAAEASDTTEDT
jgi:hypothetical protein